MLDVELIRQDPEKVKAGISKKKADPKLIDDFLAVDKTWRELLVEIETSRAAQKKAGMSKAVYRWDGRGTLMENGRVVR